LPSGGTRWLRPQEQGKTAFECLTGEPNALARQQRHYCVSPPVVTVRNTVLLVVPTAEIAVKQASTIKPNMIAYSTLVGPPSDARKRSNFSVGDFIAISLFRPRSTRWHKETCANCGVAPQCKPMPSSSAVKSTGGNRGVAPPDRGTRIAPRRTLASPRRGI
jgi:hypothetical protein